MASLPVSRSCEHPNASRVSRLRVGTAVYRLVAATGNRGGCRCHSPISRIGTGKSAPQPATFPAPQPPEVHRFTGKNVGDRSEQVSHLSHAFYSLAISNWARLIRLRCGDKARSLHRYRTNPRRRLQFVEPRKLNLEKGTPAVLRSTFKEHK
jgi:hypothetical protein